MKFVKSQFAIIITFSFLLPLHGFAQTGGIEGVVMLQPPGKPLSGAIVRISNADKVGPLETALYTKTDKDGTFQFRELPAATYILSVSHPAHAVSSREVSIDVVAKSIAPVKIQVGEISQLEKIIVRSKKFLPAVPRRDIRGTELTRLPGAFGDTLRGITTLPGVGIPNDLLGALFIRGSTPRDNLYYFDRVPLGFPYHYGGLVSTMSSSILDEVHIYPSGYGAEFGLDSQAVVDIYSRDEIAERWAGNFNVNFIYSEGVLERKIGEKGYAYAAGRRSYFDLILTHFIEEEGVLLPRFWDYQLKFFYPLSEKHELMLNAFAAADHFDFTNVDIDAYPDFLAYLKNGFEGQGIHLRSQLSSKLTSQLSFTRSLNYLNVDFTRFASDYRLTRSVKELEESGDSGFVDEAGASVLNLKINVPVYTLREDVTYQASSTFQIEPGFLFTFSPANIFEDSRRAIYTDIDAEMREIDQWVETQETFDYQFFRVEWYLQGRYRPLPYLTIVNGFRFDYFNLTDQLSIQPRTSLNFTTPIGTDIRLGYGRYEQSPRPYQMLSPEGNPHLKSSVAIHYSLEFEHRFAEQTELKLSGFYKTQEKLVTSLKKAYSEGTARIDAFKYQFVLPGDSAEYMNRSDGIAHGVEAFLRHRVDEKFFGWISYAWLNTEHRRQPSEPYLPYFFENMHTISIVANYNLTRATEIGVKWQYTSGTDKIDVSEMVIFQDPVTQGLRPLVGEISSSYSLVTLPAYHRLDMRLSRKQKIRGMKVGIFLEIVNAYNFHDAIIFDYSTGIEGTGNDSGFSSQLPRFFSAGLTLEF